MGYINAEDCASRWVWDDSQSSTGQNGSGNIYYRGDILYSYGSHFQVGRKLRTKGKRDTVGDVVTFLLNGDTFSNTTNRHQSAARGAVSSRGTPSVIIPFSVLDAAGIIPDSIRLLEVTSDTVVTTEHHSEVELPSWEWRTDDVKDYAPESEERWDKRIADAYQTAQHEWNTAIHRALWDDPDGFWTKRMPASKPYLHTRITMPREMEHWQTVGTERNLYLSSRSSDTVEVSISDDGTREYYWETRRHWLGESLIEAEISYTVVTTCTECGGFARKPYAGQMAWNERCHDCNGGRMVKTRRRKAKFLSGFDRGETRPSYFFTELPRTDAVTIEEAIEALKPDTVRLAEQMGRDIYRQGDIFAVPLEHLDKRTIRTLGLRGDFTKRGNLLGTNHEATEVAYLKDGRTLARGTLTHNPEWRRPDHRRVTMTKGKWHLIIKNTTPMSA